MDIRFFVVITCLAIGLFGKLLTRRWLNPLSVLCMMWGAIFFLASLALYNINEAQDSSYLLMLLAIFSFSVGFTFTYIFFQNKRVVFGKSRHRTDVEWKINYKIFYALGIIAIAYFLVNFLTIINVYLTGNGLAQIRSMAQSKTETSGGIVSKLLNALRVLVITPYSLAIIPVSAADFWFGKKDKRLLFICIAIILLRMLSEGGRIYLVYLFVSLFIGFTYALKSTKNEFNRVIAKIFKKNKRKMIIVSFLIIIVVAIASVSRSGDNLKRFTYYYFAMEPYMFERWKSIVDASGVHGYGVATFNGFAFSVLYLIKNMLGVNFPVHFNSVYQLILDTDAQWQVITSTGGRANAYVSAFWYFYLDGRVLGLIVFGMLYGIIMAAFFLQVKKNVNVRTVALYSFAFQSVYMTFSGISFASVYYCIAFLMLMIFSFRKIVRRLNG